MRVHVPLLAIFLTATLAASGCKSLTGGHNLPPAQRLMHPGPGVMGPGPGVLMPPPPPPPAAAMQGGSAQVAFVNPDGMRISWDVVGSGGFDSIPLVAPGRQNFPQGGIYRLKLTNIPARDGVELYPTLEVGPTTPRTEAFLSHNAIPVHFTEEDFDQVLTGNFVTKVIYLPDPEFQELALAGVETLVSTRLDPGVDPITEADRRGAIMAILRVGNKDLQMPGGEIKGGSVLSAVSHMAPIGPGGTMVGGPMAAGPTPAAPAYVAGVSMPHFGMPITGTPIGLPGPPHIPLGGQAGLRRHVMHNHTKRQIPDPPGQTHIHVEQQPGLSYPLPATKVRILEQNIAPAPHYYQPKANKYQYAP